MKKILIQFHATVDELVGFMNAVRSELGLVMTRMTLRPFKLREIDREVSVRDLEHDGDVRFLLTTEAPNVDVASPNEFYDHNHGVVGLHIGRLTEDGLVESSLAFMSTCKDKIATANRVALKLKKATKAGAVSVSALSGAEANVRSHRYTEGAKTLYEKGVKLLPIAGKTFFKLPD